MASLCKHTTPNHYSDLQFQANGVCLEVKEMRGFVTRLAYEYTGTAGLMYSVFVLCLLGRVHYTIMNIELPALADNFTAIFSARFVESNRKILN